MTDKRNASKNEKSEARQERRLARKALEEKIGRKLRPNEHCHHVKEKGSSTSGYNNSKCNLKAMSKDEHAKTASNGVRGKDCAPRKKRGG